MLEPSEQRAHLELAAQIAGLEISVSLPEERDAVVGRTRLHYLDWGTRGRPDVVFLHGGGLHARTWDLVCLALRGEARCLALDQRGHGDSEWSPELDYSFDAHLADLSGFVDQLCPGRVALVGQSLGALNALRFAARYPDRVRALVLIDAGPEVRVDGARRIAEFLRQTETVDSPEAFVEAALGFNHLRDRRLLRRSALHALRRLPDGGWMRKSDARWLRRTDPDRLAAAARELWAEVPRISCPTLVVRGGLSDVFLSQDAERLADCLPDGRWVCIERAGHTVQGDNPKRLVEVLRAFLAAAP
jgi:pimeloyl-ACP methyl ester carboxylesterase